MTKITIQGVEAAADSGAWSCSDPTLLEMLQVTIRSADAPTSAPDLDAWMAQQAVERFGATVTYQDPAEYDPAIVY